MEYLKERYRLEGLLGEGATAKVYRAFDETLGVWRAVKVLTVGQQRKETMQRRLHAEARAMAQLKHPHILQFYDFGIENNRSYIIMALAERGSLQDCVDRTGPLPNLVAISYALQVLSALAAAHAAGIIHRDVKPQNVLLDADGATLLADFGIAMLAEDIEMRQTKTGMAMGSMAFMAPEQRLDARDVDVAADLYAVGATLYYLVTGLNPIDLFAANQQSPRWEGVLPDLRAVIRRATRYEPNARYSDASAMAADLIEVLQTISPMAFFEVNRDRSFPAPAASVSSYEFSDPVMMRRQGLSENEVAVTRAAIGFLTGGLDEGPFAESGGFQPLGSPLPTAELTPSPFPVSRLDAPPLTVEAPPATTAPLPIEPPITTPPSPPSHRHFMLAWTLISAVLLAGILWWTNDYIRQMEGVFNGTAQPSALHHNASEDLDHTEMRSQQPADGLVAPTTESQANTIEPDDERAPGEPKPGEPASLDPSASAGSPASRDAPPKAEADDEATEQEADAPTTRPDVERGASRMAPPQYEREDTRQEPELMSSISDGWKKLIASLFQSKQSSSQEPDPVAPTTAPMRSKLLKGLSSPRRGR